jgi:hypothetical protein
MLCERQFDLVYRKLKRVGITVLEYGISLILLSTVRIRIVADCGLQSRQVIRKLNWATSSQFTAIPAIILIYML